MPNRNRNLSNRSQSSRRRSSFKSNPVSSTTSHFRGRNNRGSRRKKSLFDYIKYLLFAAIILIVVVAARNDFDVQDTVDDFRNLTFLELFLGEDGPTFSDDFYEKANYLALLYPQGRDVVYLDVITIQADDWEYEKMLIGGHDDLDRTLPIIAYLSERNLGRSESRGAQSHEPTGWQQNQLDIDGTSVWVKNRGHLIAYTLSFNFNANGQFAYGYLGSDDDPVNLFTQTAHSNQNVMTIYEGQIRTMLADGGEVVFKAAPIFRDDELMARGIWLQAVSTCENLLFSVFIFNEQPGVIIDHATGENWVYQ